MVSKTFDPQKFIDREFEQELFEELLQLKSAARILAIRDQGGMGKSQLLQKFQYRCRTAGRPRIPVSLVDLSQLSDQSPLTLVLLLHKELSGFLEFPTFLRLDTARRANDFTTISGTVNLQSADLHEAHVIAGGVVNKFDHAGSVTIHGEGIVFTADQQVMAHERCVRAFFLDLAQHCSQKQIVLLFDGYERCDPELQKWLVEHFFEPYFFDLQKRPPQLIVVVAGRAIPDFHQFWSLAECETLVRSVRALGRWKAGHVEECLRVHGFRYTKRQLKFFCEMIEMGSPPSLVVQTMQSILPIESQ